MRLLVTLSPITPSPCHGQRWAALTEKLATALRGYHRRYPLRAGMPREELRSRLKLSGAALDAVLARRRRRGALCCAIRAWACPSIRRRLRRNRSVVRRLLDAYRAAPTARRARCRASCWAGCWSKPDHPRGPGVAFLSQTYAEMWPGARADQHQRQRDSRPIPRSLRSSRKYALALLEHLDERKITRRDGDARVLY